MAWRPPGRRTRGRGAGGRGADGRGADGRGARHDAGARAPKPAKPDLKLLGERMRLHAQEEPRRDAGRAARETREAKAGAAALRKDRASPRPAGTIARFIERFRTEPPKSPKERGRLDAEAAQAFWWKRDEARCDARNEAHKLEEQRLTTAALEASHDSASVGSADSCESILARLRCCTTTSGVSDDDDGDRRDEDDDDLSVRELNRRADEILARHRQVLREDLERLDASLDQTRDLAPLPPLASSGLAASWVSRAGNDTFDLSDSVELEGLRVLEEVDDCAAGKAAAFDARNQVHVYLHVQGEATVSHEHATESQAEGARLEVASEGQGEPSPSGEASAPDATASQGTGKDLKAAASAETAPEFHGDDDSVEIEPAKDSTEAPVQVDGSDLRASASTQTMQTADASIADAGVQAEAATSADAEAQAQAQQEEQGVQADLLLLLCEQPEEKRSQTLVEAASHEDQGAQVNPMLAKQLEKDKGEAVAQREDAPGTPEAPLASGPQEQASAREADPEDDPVVFLLRERIRDLRAKLKDVERQERTLEAALRPSERAPVPLLSPEPVAAQPADA